MPGTRQHAEPVQVTLPNEGECPANARGRDAALGHAARHTCAVRQRVAARIGPFLRSINVNAFLKWWVTA
jgi:hypothetical protein